MATLKALLAGLLVGIVLIEGISAGLAVLLPVDLLVVSFAGGRIPAWPLFPVPALVWLLGSTAAGAMATAMGRHPAAGVGCGALLALSAFVVVTLVTPGNPMALLAAAVPLGGALAGSALARRIEALEHSVSSTDQTV